MSVTFLAPPDITGQHDPLHQAQQWCCRYRKQLRRQRCLCGRSSLAGTSVGPFIFFSGRFCRELTVFIPLHRTRLSRARLITLLFCPRDLPLLPFAPYRCIGLRVLAHSLADSVAMGLFWPSSCTGGLDMEGLVGNYSIILELSDWHCDLGKRIRE